MGSQSSPLRASRARKFKSEINVVPYIDVMLVLLVIFMVTSPLANPGVIDLPTAAKSPLPPSEYIQVNLKPDASASIGVSSKNSSGKTETASGRADLVRRLGTLHEQNPDLPLMISADKNIKYDEVIQTISEAKKLGIARVGLATRQ